MMFVANGMRPMFDIVQAKLPDRFRVTMSLTKRKKAIGVCYHPDCSGDQTYEILIRLDQANPMEVAAVLAHELIHSAVGLEHGHKGEFKRVALEIGLEGKMTNTVAGDLFKSSMKKILEDAGPFPHAALDWNGKKSGPKKQTTRMKKTECQECGYTVRVTEKWLEVGPPSCPEHGSMQIV